jgi:hypothetical protein
VEAKSTEHETRRVNVETCFVACTKRRKRVQWKQWLLLTHISRFWHSLTVKQKQNRHCNRKYCVLKAGKTGTDGDFFVTVDPRNWKRLKEEEEEEESQILYTFV